MPSSPDRGRIYALYSYLPRLEERSGDQISEIGTLGSLATQFDVFYNNQLFQAGLPDFGLQKIAVEPPEGEYDLVYVRDNKEIFFEAKRRGYRTAYLGDFDAEIYESADVLVVHNQTTKRFLEGRHQGEPVDERFDAIFPQRCPLPCEIIVLEQPGRAEFSMRAESTTARRLRMKWGDDFVIGFFGRIDETCMPRIALAAIPDVRHELPRARFVMAGRVKRGYAAIPGVSYEPKYFSVGEMPHALSACDAILGIEQREAEWSGSNRTVEAMRCAVPFLTMPYSARVEQLGADYPLYYRTTEEFFQKIMSLRYEASFRERVVDYLMRRREIFDVVEMRRRNAARVHDFLERGTVAIA